MPVASWLKRPLNWFTRFRSKCVRRCHDRLGVEELSGTVDVDLEAPSRIAPHTPFFVIGQRCRLWPRCLFCATFKPLVLLSSTILTGLFDKMRPRTVLAALNQ
jgi:hypothetical protein